jgi:hypothetical protein
MRNDAYSGAPAAGAATAGAAEGALLQEVIDKNTA